jgi:hypothetical protein
MTAREVLIACRLSGVVTLRIGTLLIVASAFRGQAEAQLFNPPPPKYVGLPGVDAPRTLKYVTELEYHVPGGLTYKHKCKSGCVKDSGNAEINVVAQKRARKLDWFEALKLGEPGGYVVAKVTNLAADTIPEFGLAPGGEMYQWVGHVTDGATRVAFFRMDATGRITWVAMDQYVNACEEEKGKKKSRVKYDPKHNKECKQVVGQGSLSAAGVQIRVPAQTWISCKTGCCQVDPNR